MTHVMIALWSPIPILSPVGTLGRVFDGTTFDLAPSGHVGTGIYREHPSVVHTLSGISPVRIGGGVPTDVNVCSEVRRVDVRVSRVSLPRFGTRLGESKAREHKSEQCDAFASERRRENHGGCKSQGPAR